MSWEKERHSSFWRNWSTRKQEALNIYAEVVGYGATSDAYHITMPDPEGEGNARAMQMAIDEAGIRPEDISYINARRYRNAL